MPSVTLIKGMRTFDTVENLGYILIRTRGARSLPPKVTLEASAGPQKSAVRGAFIVDLYMPESAEFAQPVVHEYDRLAVNQRRVHSKTASRLGDDDDLRTTPATNDVSMDRPIYYFC